MGQSVKKLGGNGIVHHLFQQKETFFFAKYCFVDKDNNNNDKKHQQFFTNTLTLIAGTFYKLAHITFAPPRKDMTIDCPVGFDPCPARPKKLVFACTAQKSKLLPPNIHGEEARGMNAHL